MSMPFSQRTDWNVEVNPLEAARLERRQAGLPIADLTASNPTRCGFHYPDDLLLSLTNPSAFDYDPNPRGSLAVREAVCRYYAHHGAVIDSASVILTTSTSEAYSYLFKLLCNPGDAILVPRPCYPLFDFLAAAEVVELTDGAFVYDHGWQLEMESLRRSITPRTRAIVLVHPNNPTGHFTKREEARELADLCRKHQLALIVDEVFLDYRVEDGSKAGLQQDDTARSTFLARDLGILTFVVSGISKIAGLPQMKAAWLAATGPGMDEALARLEVLADTYLSMNAPIQCALPKWIEQRDAIQQQISARVNANLAALDREIQAQPAGRHWVGRLQIEGGWYATLRIPATEPDEQAAIRLLSNGVYLHPGSFFGMSDSGWLVASLLTPEVEFLLGIKALLHFFELNHNSYEVEGFDQVQV
jgi:aspartate/methionine/tyrosine aminotransferase